MIVLVFGDSISFGQYVSPHMTWVGKLSQYLYDLNPEILLQCEAVNGRTTRMALEAMPKEVQNYKPDILIVQFGLNDCNFWETDNGLPRVSLKAFRENIGEIISRALHFGVKKVYLNTNHPTCKYNSTLEQLLDDKYEKKNQIYNDAIKEVCREYAEFNVELIDLHAAFNEEMATKNSKVKDYLLEAPDCLHLNEKGHNLYYMLIREKLTGFLNKINS